MHKQRIIDKIAKLLAHKDSAEAVGSVEEAIAFTEKIQDLLIKYKLSLQEIPKNDDNEHNSSKDLDRIEIFTLDNIRIIDINSWESLLISSIAKYLFCRILVGLLGNVNIIGTEQDARAVTKSIHYLLNAVKQEAAKAKTRSIGQSLLSWELWVSITDPLTYEGRTPVFDDFDLDDFCLGATYAIDKRLEKRKHTTKDSAIVLKKSYDMLEEFTRQWRRADIKLDRPAHNRATQEGFLFGLKVPLEGNVIDE